MSYHGLDRPPSPLYYVFYKTVFVLVLLGALGLLFYATSRVEYTWRWNRVPQYFWASGQTELRAETDGTITGIRTEGGTVRVVITPTDGNDKAVTIQVLAGSHLRLSEDTDVYYGDIIADVQYSEPGILLKGLWITIEVSEAGAQVLGKTAAVLAYGEGLQGHARAAEMRLK